GVPDRRLRCGGGCLQGHQRRRRARPGGRDHRLRAVPARRPRPAGPRPPRRDRRSAGPARRRHVRRLRGLRGRHRGGPAGGAARGADLHPLCGRPSSL
ncbi:MAG: hypothetical protein AVDCRST_MAG36-497, partial [uncultured Nocardioidaceae bacterium]